MRLSKSEVMYTALESVLSGWQIIQSRWREGLAFGDEREASESVCLSELKCYTDITVSCMEAAVE